jgi:hypothetical protein
MGKYDATLAALQNVEVTDTTFNTPLGNYMRPGKHRDCRISAIESLVSKAGNDYFRLTFENQEGETITHSVSITGTDKQSGKKIMHWTYRNLASALSGDPALCKKFFFETMLQNELENGLVGMRLNVTVDAPTVGYTLRKDEATGQFVLYDLETGKPWADLDQTIFNTIDEGRAYAEANNIFRGYANVGKVQRPGPELLEANEAALRALVNKAGSATDAGNSSAPVAMGSSL